MNDIIEKRAPVASVGTFAIIGLTAAMSAGQLAWPKHDSPSYEAPHTKSSYSYFIEKKLTFNPSDSEQKFAQEIAEFYATLCEKQEPLGAEFEAIWDENIDSLYES